MNDVKNEQKTHDLVLMEQKVEFGSYCDLHPFDPTCIGSGSGSGSGSGGGTGGTGGTRGS